MAARCLVNVKRWWRRLRGGRPVDEICRECFEQLHARSAWETVTHYRPVGDEAGFGGGTFGTAYWCRRHRPDDATRVARGSLPLG
jgi:hypothetical protein